MDYSKLIKKYRLKKQISQEQLARNLGICTRTIQNWESGKKISEMKKYMLKEKGII